MSEKQTNSAGRKCKHVPPAAILSDRGTVRRPAETPSANCRTLLSGGSIGATTTRSGWGRARPQSVVVLLTRNRSICTFDTKSGSRSRALVRAALIFDNSIVDSAALASMLRVGDSICGGRCVSLGWARRMGEEQLQSRLAERVPRTSGSHAERGTEEVWRQAAPPSITPRRRPAKVRIMDRQGFYKFFRRREI